MRFRPKYRKIALKCTSESGHVKSPNPNSWTKPELRSLHHFTRRQCSFAGGKSLKCDIPANRLLRQWSSLFAFGLLVYLSTLATYRVFSRRIPFLSDSILLLRFFSFSTTVNHVKNIGLTVRFVSWHFPICSKQWKSNCKYSLDILFTFNADAAAMQLNQIARDCQS